MSKEHNRIADGYFDNGYTRTSIDGLEIELDRILVEDLLDLTEKRAQRLSARNNQKTFVTAPHVLKLARTVTEPLVSVLFPNEPSVVENFKVSTAVFYRKGDIFKPHKDQKGEGTVAILSLSELRQFIVYEEKKINVMMLEEGSVVLLNGSIDPLHDVKCIEGPSVSLIADLPLLPRVA